MYNFDINQKTVYYLMKMMPFKLMQFSLHKKKIFSDNVFQKAIYLK